MNVLDLFCGAGGFSAGFEEAGFNVVAGIDHNETAVQTFEKNHKGSVGITADLSQLPPEEAESKIQKDIDVIIGGPPCKGFTSIRPNRSSDKIDFRNYLYRDFLNYIEHFDPDVFVMENVPDITTHQTDSGDKILEKIIERVEEMGYEYEWKILDAVDYGVPQKRERFILIATKTGEVEFPEPDDEVVTVEEAFRGLCVLEAGQQSQYPEHTAANHSDDSLQVIRYADETIDDIPEDLRPQGFNTSYSRLHMHEPATTLTTKFTVYSATRSIHPYEDRALTILEGKRLQSFPDDYEFTGGKTEKAKQIGNAVPPKLAKAIAEEVKDLLPTQEQSELEEFLEA